MGRSPLDLTNQHFGYLKAEKRLKKQIKNSYVWLCLCDPKKGGCGKKCKRTAAQLASGKSHSCGCGRGNGGKAAKKVKRNGLIYEQWQGGVSSGLLAKKHKISRARIQEIVRKEAESRGEELRDTYATVRDYDSRAPVEISDKVKSAYLNHEITASEAAAKIGISTTWFAQLVRRESGENVLEDRREKARERDADIYAQFMAGGTLEELAKQYEVSKGCVAQWIIRHRKRTGAPPKSPHLAGKRTAG